MVPLLPGAAPAALQPAAARSIWPVAGGAVGASELLPARLGVALTVVRDSGTLAPAAAAAGVAALVVAARRHRRGARRRATHQALQAARPKKQARKVWDEIDDLDDDFDPVGVAGKGSISQSGQIDNFKNGADFAAAKIFAATRTVAVAPWDQDVTPKPIFAVSDSTGLVAEKLSLAAFRQFGPGDLSQVITLGGVRTSKDVKRVVAKAAKMAPPGALAIEKLGAILVYTLASQERGKNLVDECQAQGVPCINVLEPVLTAIEKVFGVPRSLDWETQETARKGKAIFAVSDSSSATSYDMVRAAVKQFPTVGVETVVVCDEVRSLDDINMIVEGAQSEGSPVIFSFASPGMSRFMRQQCERAKVAYADALQPLLIAFETYLDYPPVGVPGGHDLKGGASTARLLRRSILD